MNKRVAITGITGLLGSRLANVLAEQGFIVYGIFRDEPSNIDLHPNINKVYGNINSFEDVKYFIEKANPEYVYHLAAQTQALGAVSDPYGTFYTNFLGTLNILECARIYSRAKAIIVASTDKAYGELNDKEYIESTQLNGKYPYDASKVSTEIVSKSYRETYGMPIIITRACNIYGPGDNNSQRLIPGIFKSYVDNSEFTIRNSGESIREYIYVDDVVDAYIKIADHAANQNLYPVFNISSGERYSTLEVFELIEKNLGKKIKSKTIFDYSKEIKNQIMSSSLLESATSWRPKVTFEDGISKIASWYLNKNQ